MKKQIFLYKIETCIGCHSCQYACAEKKGLREGIWFRRVLHMEKVDGYQGAYSAACNHCESPACVSVCPTGAMMKDSETGLVLHDDSKCIGCGSCQWACPYGAVTVDPALGMAVKCDGCKALREDSKDPWCVLACPTRCLKLVSPEAAEAEGGRMPDLPFLPASDRTMPQTRILSEKGGAAK